MTKSVQPDMAVIASAQRAAADGNDRFVLAVLGETGTMTYGTIFASTGAAQDEAAMLRRMGQDRDLFLVAARVDGDVSLEQLAA